MNAVAGVSTPPSTGQASLRTEREQPAAIGRGNVETAAAPPKVYYECQRCTACCRWPGQVRLTDGGIARLASFLGMTEFDFVQKFTRLRPDRRGLSLIEKPGGDCIFLDGTDCRVQTVKPQQCRDFPNTWNFPGWEKICQARPRN